MHARFSFRSFTAPRAVLLLWLVLALVVAPMLGQVHRTLHGGGDGPAVSAAQALQHTGHGIESLFGSHDSAGDCRLYDQLGHADGAACVPVLALPVMVPLFFITFLQGEAVARFAALFDARGPPTFR